MQERLDKMLNEDDEAREPDEQSEKSGQLRLDVDVVPLTQMIQMCSSGGTFPSGTVSVSATDKSTGKKQSITIRSSVGPSDSDVEKMVLEFQEQLSNTDDRMATVQKSIAELEDSAVKTIER